MRATHWVRYPAPLFADDKDGAPTASAFMKIAQNEKVAEDNRLGSLSHVTYITKSNQVYRGWVNNVFLEEYISAGDVVDYGDFPTPTFQDANQYLFYNRRLVHNICGVACLCRVLGFTLPQMIEMMKEKTPAYYSAVMVNDKGLGLPALEAIAAAAGAETRRLYESLITDGRFILSPGRLNEILRAGWGIIIGVRIDYSGYLTDSGLIGHWMTLEFIEPFGVGNGKAEGFNSYDNSINYWEYREMIRSMKKWNSFSGLILRKGKSNGL
jgi:hypothetical protein